MVCTDGIRARRRGGFLYCGKTSIGTVFAPACGAIASSHTTVSTLLVSTLSPSPLALSTGVRATPKTKEHAGRAVGNILAFGCFFGALFTIVSDRWAQKAVLVDTGIAVGRFVSITLRVLGFVRVRRLLA